MWMEFAKYCRYVCVIRMCVFVVGWIVCLGFCDMGGGGTGLGIWRLGLGNGR